MEHWIDFAKGPLFALTFLIMILGLARLVLIQVYSLATGKGRRLTQAPWRKIMGEAASWIVPIKHLIPGTKLFSVVSYVFHVGVIIVPLFLADHIALWEKLIGINLPAIGYGLADFLTLFTVGCVIVLFGFRMFLGRLRAMSRPADYALLLLVAAPFASGYLAMHPAYNPLPWDVMMLLHLLSAEALFLAIPFTKLAHIVLFFFDRISGLHWQLRPGAGDKVAEVLYGKEARV